MVGLEQRAVVECRPGVAFNNERDQKLCQIQGSERSNYNGNRDTSKFGCYCKHSAVAVLSLVLLPRQFTEAPTLKLQFYTDSAKVIFFECPVITLWDTINLRVFS